MSQPVYPATQLFKKQFTDQPEPLVTPCQHDPCAHNTLCPASITHTSQAHFAYQQGALITVLQHEPCALNTRSPVNMTHTSKEQSAYQQGALITVFQHEPCLLIHLCSVSTIDV